MSQNNNNDDVILLDDAAAHPEDDDEVEVVEPPPAKKQKKPETFEIALCTTQSKDPLDPMCFQADVAGGQPTQGWLDKYGTGPPPFIQRLIDSGALSNFDVLAGQWEVGKEGTLHYQWCFKLAKPGATRKRYSIQKMRDVLSEGLKLVNGVTYTTDTNFPKINTHFSCGTASLKAKGCSPSFKAMYNYCTYDTYPMDYYVEELRGVQKRVKNTEPYIFNPGQANLSEEKGTTNTVISRLNKGDKDIDILSDLPLNMVGQFDKLKNKWRDSLPQVTQKCGNNFCTNRRFCNDLDTYGPALILRYKKEKNVKGEVGLDDDPFKEYLAEIGKPCRFTNYFLFGEPNSGKTTDAVTLAEAASLEDHDRKDKTFTIDERKGFFGTLDHSAQGASAIIWNEISASMFDGNLNVFKQNFECKSNFMNTKNGDALNTARLNIATSNPCPIELMESLNKGKPLAKEDYGAYLRRWNGFFKFRFPSTNDIASFRLHNPHGKLPFRIVSKATPPSFESYSNTFRERSVSIIGNPLATKTPYVWTLGTDISSFEWDSLMKPARILTASAL